MRLRAAAFLILSATIVGAPRADAQGTARSMDIDTSIRASGMAAASTAVFFGDDLNSWANPALLGYVSGVHYQRGRTRLLSGLPGAEIFLSSEHVRVGGAGVGLVLSGRPVLAGVKLDYGPGTFDGFEEVEAWGFGVSTRRAAEGILMAAGGSPAPRSDKADVSFGMNFKRTHRVAPGFFEDSGNTVDWGVLLKARPLVRSAPGAGVPLWLDAAAGFGVINANDETFSGFRPTRQQRVGIAMHLALDPPAWGLAPGGSRPWYLEGLSPLFSFGIAGDWTRVSAGGQEPRYDTWGLGVEATMLNAVTLRSGYYYDRIGEIEDPTFGFALTLPMGKVAGVRYEQSSFPQASVSWLTNLTRRSFTVWVDPLETWTLSRRSAAD